MTMVLAIVLGILFGFALNRVGATNPENIINMLRLTDLRLMKAILFAIGLSSVALFTGIYFGLVDPSHVSIKSAYVGVIVGGAMLGIGFAIAGYCPGTGLAAFATGRKDALFFVLGGLLGAFAYMYAYGWFNTNTELFSEIAGGSVSLVNTGNEKYTPLIASWNGTLVGIVFGFVFIWVSVMLPTSFRK